MSGRRPKEKFAVVDDEPPGFQRDLWALPSEELPPGAAVFLDMARDLQAGLGDPAAGWIGPDALAPPFDPDDLYDADDLEDPYGLEDPYDPDDLEDPADLVVYGPGGPVAERPDLRLILSPGEPPGLQRPAEAPAPGEDPGAKDVLAPADEEGARVFLEMVDLTETVRPIGPARSTGPTWSTGSTGPTGRDAEDEPAIPDWFWLVAGDEGIPASEVLLSTIEQAIQHVNQSEDIRSEEVRRRLLDLFTDFAVRRPWREEERPAAQRIQRLPEQPPEDASGPSR